MASAPHLKLVEPLTDDRAAALRAAFAAADPSGDNALLLRTLDWVAQHAAGRMLAGGEPMFEHAVAAATILRAFKPDAECVAAGLLARLAEDPLALVAMREELPPAVCALAEGAARMLSIEQLGGRVERNRAAGAQLESLRKMLLAMVQDMRVVLIKLADHVQRLRFMAKSSDEAQRRATAHLALDIYAPLANRLGVWQLKWEIEDLALRILDPETYQNIARWLDEKRDDRESYIAAAIAQLRAALTAAGITAELSGRPKHIYSIYNKMRGKHLDFTALYDVRAVRAIVDDVKSCYTVLGIVHNLWTPLPGEFDDYIARPKGNHYRSLHTAVIGPAGKPLEIQIRTDEMHQHAEFGVAAHWRYKEGSHRDARYDDKIAWLRQVVEWQDEMADVKGLFADTIYVLTPQGRVVDLPADATPIDFAYRLHSDLGHRCRGARVDGAMVPLNTPLANGQCVEIIAARQGGPSRDWLNPALGFLKSAGARGRVRQWFNRQNLEASVAQGRAIVDRELQRQGLTRLNLETVAHQFGFERLDDFLADVGRGEIGPRQLQNGLLPPAAPSTPAQEVPIVRKARAQPGGILVVGVDKLLTVPARCCKPAPPDAIIGFVSRGRGVTIHRRGCLNVPRLSTERLVEAEWGDSPLATFPVDIVIEAGDRTGLLRDITEILSREQINVTATHSASRAASARMLLTVEVPDLRQLERVLALIRAVPGVARAARR
jgi:GTP pyrophosphokinase